MKWTKEIKRNKFPEQKNTYKEHLHCNEKERKEYIFLIYVKFTTHATNTRPKLWPTSFQATPFFWLTPKFYGPTRLTPPTLKFYPSHTRTHATYEPTPPTQGIREEIGLNLQINAWCILFDLKYIKQQIQHWFHKNYLRSGNFFRIFCTTKTVHISIIFKDISSLFFFVFSF